MISKLTWLFTQLSCFALGNSPCRCVQEFRVTDDGLTTQREPKARGLGEMAQSIKRLPSKLEGLSSGLWHLGQNPGAGPARGVVGKKTLATCRQAWPEFDSRTLVGKGENQILQVSSDLYTHESSPPLPPPNIHTQSIFLKS